MNPIGPVHDGGTPMPSVVNQQVNVVIPLWRPVGIFGLGRAPTLGEPGGRGVDLVVVRLRGRRRRGIRARTTVVASGGAARRSARDQMHRFTYSQEG
ncbi:hypothetical protein [Streptomyces sp. NPDC050704]|uniref:hypothetical protein n=1 Tax=Streptomyces sp. NPDC050704 TaxID=3157219 RepID=UPI003447F66B